MKLEKFKIDFSLSENRKAVIKFFIRLSLMFTVWFFIYGLFLGPARIIDKPVTNIITISVVKCINLLSGSSTQISWATDANIIGRNYLTADNKEVFGIWDVCNGVDLMFIYISIIVLLPYPVKRKIIFSIGGIVAIILANIIRVCALYFIYVYQKSAFDFSHHYLFTILMYVFIFYGWLLFIKKKKAI